MYLEPVNVLYFVASTFQKKAEIPTETRGPIWVSGIYV